jgi:hypothetical protein
MFPVLLAVLTSATAPNAGPPALPAAEERALAYLAREVPRWSKKKHCFSCHHNGDAARVLSFAARVGFAIPPVALADTTAWLELPGRWDRNGGQGSFSDKKLARLQFAASLAEAHRTGLTKDQRALECAARFVVALQDQDGSFRIGEGGSLGSPATHGTALATHLARRTLHLIDRRRYKETIARADGWLRKTPITSVLDAAAILLALGRAKDNAAVAQKRRCIEQIRKGARRNGGWGPWARSPEEVFDTAIVVLALAAQQEQTPQIKAWMKQGRAYLLATQEKDGNWEETTRPSGSGSYAQRLSTTAWATLALLHSRNAK